MADRGARDGGSGVGRDDRGVAPVAGKALEIAVVVLYVAMLSTALYGGAVPDYRTAAGAELGERTLAEAARSVERAVPTPVTSAGAPATNASSASNASASNATATRIEVRVSLPGRLRGSAYAIRAANDSALVLDHPRAAIDSRVRLALPGTVASVTGEWASGGRAVVRVREGPDGLHVELIAR